MTLGDVSNAAAGPAPSSGALQHASNLLALLHDEQIWSRMLRAGYPDDWRTELTSALVSARADYSQCRAWRAADLALVPRGNAQGDAQGDARGNAQGDAQQAVPSTTDATLRDVVERICIAGQHTFSETESLTRRFAPTAPDSGRR